MAVDHIVPLNHKLLRGLHWHGNFQYLTKAENCAKGTRLPDTMTIPRALWLRLAVWRGPAPAPDEMEALVRADRARRWHQPSRGRSMLVPKARRAA